MGRPNRVLSFMSQWGGGSHHQKSPSSAGPSPMTSPAPASPSTKQPTSNAYSQSATALDSYNHQRSASQTTNHIRSDSRPSSRPMSMIQTYQPPVMEVGQDTLPELQRIFTFLNSHSNKLYQEGYFLKFHDTDTRGRPAPDRKWQEYFVQLVGTILSLWDASELDTAGGDVEVLPTFINLTDAAIHMIPSMTLKDGKKLDNILSVSTAASNKFLFHFDSYHALTQWTAGIRLAMFEHTTLQEAYTGALIAGKGKTLNNIRNILDRQCPPYDDWVRVRFGAGTPWRRCWCVVAPPDQKELAKLQKSQKKTNVYGRAPTQLKGDIKFYDTKKITKKTRPIATVKDAYSCYAIYPQSKPLIEQSTLVKIEGKITVHSNPESTTEGFVFVMPESRPPVPGFEIMLQYLFPVFDTFGLYGRPKKLIADVLDSRGLMFAMPSDKRYGYLEMWDVVGLINTEGSSTWSERQWRKQLKDLTSTRMSALRDSDSVYSRASRRNTMSRTGVTSSRGNLRFEDRNSIRSNPSTRQTSPVKRAHAEFESQTPRRADTAPAVGPFAPPRHQRSVSEQVNGYNSHKPGSGLARGDSLEEEDFAPAPPVHGGRYGVMQNGQEFSDSDESPIREHHNLPELQADPAAAPRGPVDIPPTHAHAASQKPPVRPSLPPTMKPNPAVDTATLHQMADATQSQLPLSMAAAGAAAAMSRSSENLHSRRSGEYGSSSPNGMHLNAMRPPPSNHSSDKRLSTIPASPYVEHAEFVQAPSNYQPVAPPVPEHAQFPQESPSQELPFRPHPNSGSSIHRKPLPGRSPMNSRENATPSTKSSSLSSFPDIVKESPDNRDSSHFANYPLLLRNQSKSSSLYSDDVSTSTPDYASVASEEPVPRRLPERREDRPRSGVLRTIGDPNYKPIPRKAVAQDEAGVDATSNSQDLPNIDFGPTYTLDFNNEKRPGTSGTMTQMTHDRSASKSKENLALNERNASPNPAWSTDPASIPQTESRSVAWQPGMTNYQQPDRQMMDPQDWVMHRASQQPQTMMYGHGRTMSKTPPPFGRKQSGDWAQLKNSPDGSSRPPSRPLSRPHSRGSEFMLDQRSHQLSAREQEQVARMTNTPLLDMSHNPKKLQKPAPQGLTGYIDFREKEKAAAKASRHGHTSVMQAEIDRRNQQAQQKQMMEAQQRQRQMMEMQQQQMYQQSAMAQSNYAPSMMGGASMGSPSVMGVPAGPGTPGMAYSPHMYQQQQQYFPQQPTTPQMHIPGAWGAQTPQSTHGQYFPQQQQQPATQPYGASFDQAAAAARFAQQQQQFRR